MKLSNTHHVTKKGSLKKNPPKANSSDKVVIYQGDWVNRGERVSFNLYEMEDIDFAQTKDALLDYMRSEHLKLLRALFAQAGLKLHDFDYYSPSEYNFKGDSMDLKISIGNRSVLRQYIMANASGIQKALDGNSSYDGYMSLTSDSVEEVVSKLDDNFDLDTMVVSYILSQYNGLSSEDIFDNIVYDGCEEVRS